MKFYKNAAMVACVILIVTLAIIASVLIFDKSKISFPPVISECPDYWVDGEYLKTPEGQKQISDDNELLNVASTATPSDCVNFKKVGKCLDDPNKLIMNPNDFEGGEGVYNGSKICNQFKWAESCGVSWDGITNRQNVCDVV
jgi:hypothetical protein